MKLIALHGEKITTFISPGLHTACPGGVMPLKLIVHEITCYICDI